MDRMPQQTKSNSMLDCAPGPIGTIHERLLHAKSEIADQSGFYSSLDGGIKSLSCDSSKSLETNSAL